MYCNNLNKATTKLVPKNVLSRTILPGFLEGLYQSLLYDVRIKLKKVHATWLEEVNNTKMCMKIVFLQASIPFHILTAILTEDKSKNLQKL